MGRSKISAVSRSAWGILILCVLFSPPGIAGDDGDRSRKGAQSIDKRARKKVKQDIELQSYRKVCQKNELLRGVPVSVFSSGPTGKTVAGDLIKVRFLEEKFRSTVAIHLFYVSRKRDERESQSEGSKDQNRETSPVPMTFEELKVARVEPAGFDWFSDKDEDLLPTYQVKTNPDAKRSSTYWAVVGGIAMVDEAEQCFFSKPFHVRMVPREDSETEEFPHGIRKKSRSDSFDLLDLLMGIFFPLYVIDEVIGD